MFNYTRKSTRPVYRLDRPLPQAILPAFSRLDRVRPSGISGSMLFNSLIFLVFLPSFLVLYYATRGQARLWVCLLGSYFFYANWDWRFLSLIWLSTAVDYYVGRRLERETATSKRKHLLWISIGVNLGLLGFFKYFNFFTASFADLLAALHIPCEPLLLNILLPVGISFYTFQTLSYSIDLYHRKIEAEHSLLRFATFVAFFPQLVAGPIVRAGSLLPQLREDRMPTWEQVLTGLHLIAWGFFLKVVLADSLAPVSDSRFAHPFFHSSLSLMVGVVAYAFQIYGDFSGYSCIAIGIGRILGFDFGANFDRPYFSTSFSEFWRRWHISLSSWLRDYLYIPLGGNRHGNMRTHVNLMLTMFLGGLWHGANWTFIAWGILHGGYLILQRYLGPIYGKCIATCRIPETVSRLFLWALVFLLTCLAWIFFRAQTIGDAFEVIQRILAFDDMSPGSIRYRFLAFKGLAIIAFVGMIELASFRLNLKEIGLRHPWLIFVSAGCLLLGISLLGSFSGKTFIYFQF